MGRSKGSKNKKSDLTELKEAVSTTKKPKIIEKIINSECGIFRRHIWANVPSDLTINELTPVGSRLISAEHPEQRYFLKHYIPSGAHDPSTGFPYPNGGVVVTSRNLDYQQSFHPEGVMLHSSKQVMEEIPREFKHFTDGHRDGSIAAEKAALRAMKKAAILAKRQAKINAKQAKIDARQAKIDAKNAKKKARLDKKQAKIDKKSVRLAKRLAKEEKMKKRSKALEKTASIFLDLKTTIKKKLDSSKKKIHKK